MGFFNTSASRTPQAPTTSNAAKPRCSMAELFHIVRAAIDPTTFSLTDAQRVRIARETGHDNRISAVEERLYSSLMAAEEARLLVSLGDVSADEGTAFAAILQRDALDSLATVIEARP